MGAAYVKDLRQLTDYGGYAVSRQWHSSKHNTGMAMTRALFNGQIKKCAKEFCERDEYNWGKFGDNFNLKASKYYFALPCICKVNSTHEIDSRRQVQQHR